MARCARARVVGVDVGEREREAGDEVMTDRGRISDLRFRGFAVLPCWL